MNREEALGAFVGALAAREAPDAAALAALGLEPGVAALYRKLVRRNFLGAVEKMAPRFLAAVGPALLDELLARGGPRSRYLRDVPLELVRLAREAEGLPAWAADLGDWELATFRAMAAPDDPPPGPPEELDLGRGVGFSESLRVLALGFAVHAWDGRGEPEARAVHLAVHRTPDGEPREEELSAPVARVVRALLAGATLGDAARGGAAGPLDPAFVAELAGALERLGPRPRG